MNVMVRNSILPLPQMMIMSMANPAAMMGPMGLWVRSDLCQWVDLEIR